MLNKSPGKRERSEKWPRNRPPEEELSVEDKLFVCLFVLCCAVLHLSIQFGAKHKTSSASFSRSSLFLALIVFFFFLSNFDLI